MQFYDLLSSVPVLVSNQLRVLSLLSFAGLTGIPTLQVRPKDKPVSARPLKGLQSSVQTGQFIFFYFDDD